MTGFEERYDLRLQRDLDKTRWGKFINNLYKKDYFKYEAA